MPSMLNILIRQVLFSDLYPRQSNQIRLNPSNSFYHSRELRLETSKPVELKLQQEFERAQAHMEAQVALDTSFKLHSYPIEQQEKKVSGFAESVGIAHAQGRRPTMEDAHVVSTCTSLINGKPVEYGLFGVIDGHSGNAVAKFVAAHIGEEIEKSISKHGISDTGIRNALKEAFVQLDNRVVYEVHEQAGAVATIALKIGSTLWTANLGDCRSLLKMGKKVVQLSVDAKPDHPRFQPGVERRGGTVKKVYGCASVNGTLAVPRAFGDKSLKGARGYYVISPRPKITKFDLTSVPAADPVHLIQACDGIWDVLTSQQAASLVDANRSCAENATSIVCEAIGLGSTDNCSVLVAQL